MACGPDRLVRRIQRRQELLASVGPAGLVSGRDLTELQARVRRLQALGRSFVHVRLSPDVARCDATEIADGVGGERVATEV